MLVIAVALGIGRGLVDWRQHLGQAGATASSPRVVVPSDFVVEATLTPIAATQGLPPAAHGQWTYVLDLRVDNRGPDGDYAVDIYPYIEGAAVSVLDFGKGFDSTGKAVGGVGITLGENGARLAAGRDALRQRLPTIEPRWNPEGVSFIGNRGPLEVRFGVVIGPSDLPLQANEMAVVIVYTAPSTGAVTWTSLAQVSIH